MPGVKAILTADDLPAVVAGANLGEGHHRQHAQRARPDDGAALRGRADSRRRRGRRVDGRRGDRADPRSSTSRCPSSSIRSRACGPAAPNARTEGNVWVRPAPAARRARRAATPAGPQVQELKWTDEDFAAAERRPAAARQAHRRVGRRRRRRRLQAGRPRARRDVRRHRTPAISRSRRARRWPTGRTASSTCTARRRARCGRSAPSRAGSASSPTNVVIISEYTGGGFGSKGSSSVFVVGPGAAVEEGQRAGDDAHHARRRAVHRPRASGAALARQGRLPQGRPHHRARRARHRRQRPVRRRQRCAIGRRSHLAVVPADGDAVAQR